MKRVKTKAHLTGEHFTHRSVWHAGSVLEKMGSDNEDGGWHATLAAMLFTYIALEAYLNFVGERLFPDTWRDERAFFSGPRYRGTLGKLDFLLEQCELVLDKGRRPYQTIRSLDERRKCLVHPRPERIDRVVSYTDPSELRVKYEFNMLADEAFVAHCRRDVEAVCDQIQTALSLRAADPAWGERAFVGLIGHLGGWLAP